jgi:hypothetical protein
MGEKYISRRTPEEAMRSARMSLKCFAETSPGIVNDSR